VAVKETRSENAVQPYAEFLKVVEQRLAYTPPPRIDPDEKIVVG
jgi:hypothetical protein